MDNSKRSSIIYIYMFLNIYFSQDRNNTGVVKVIVNNENNFSAFHYHKKSYPNYTHSKTLQMIRDRNKETDQ